MSTTHETKEMRPHNEAKVSIGQAIRFYYTQFIGDISLKTTTVVLAISLLILNTASTYFTHIGISETNWIALAYNYSFPGRFGYAFTAIIGTQMATRSLTHGTLSRVFVANKSHATTVSTFFACAIIHFIVLSIIFSLLHWAIITGALNVAGTIDGFPPRELTEAAIRAVIVMVLWGIVGLSVGLIVRSPFIAVSVILGVVLVIEPTMTAVAYESGGDAPFLMYLPGSLNWALTWPRVEPYIARAHTAEISHPLAAFLLLIYTFVLSAFAWWKTPQHKLNRRIS
ncbi:MAG: hypothetical protein Q4A92_01670 [Corynebacterium sp.]|nr:hypothetical protein [Corynebacterium sp.]